MGQTKHRRSTLGLVAFLMAGLLAWPSAGLAQLGGLLPPTGSTTTGITGDATAVRATLLGSLGALATTTSLSDTGTLAGSAVAREASQTTGSIPSLLDAEVLHAVTIGWPDQVASEASLANLNLTVAGISIFADSILARASQVSGAARHRQLKHQQSFHQRDPDRYHGEPQSDCAHTRRAGGHQ